MKKVNKKRVVVNPYDRFESWVKTHVKDSWPEEVNNIPFLVELYLGSYPGRTRPLITELIKRTRHVKKSTD